MNLLPSLLPFLFVPPAAPPPRALVRPILAKSFPASPAAIEGGKAVFTTAGGNTRTLPLDSLEEISFGDPSPPPPRGPFLFLPGGESIPLFRIQPGRRGGLVPLFPGKRLREIPLDKIAGFQWPRRPGGRLPSSLPELDPSKRPEGRDLLFLVKGREIMKVAVTLLSLDRKGLRFEFGGKERTVSLWKVAGVLLGKPPGTGKPAAPLPTQSVEFARGGRLLGRILEGDARGLTFLHPLLGKIRIPWEAVLRLRPSLDHVRGVDTLEILSDRAVPAFDRIWPFSMNRNLEGSSIRIGGRYFEEGLVFLPRRTLTFLVPPGFRVFKAVLGIEDGGGGEGAAAFRVKAGDKAVFEKLIRAGDPPLEVVLDLGKARRFSLEADFGPALDLGDHCAFARARLLRPPGGEDAP